MGLGLREIIIILLVVGIVFLPWFRKVAAPRQTPKIKRRPKREKPDIIDAEWEEVED